MPVIYSFTTLETFEILDASVNNYSSVRVTFNIDAKQTDQFADDDALRAGNYLIQGGPRSLAVRSVTSVSATEVDLEIDEMKDGEAYVVIGAETLASTTGLTIAGTLPVNPEADRADFVGLGEAPRVLSASNTSAGIIAVEFSEPMSVDNVITAIETYTIEKIGDAADLFITSVTVDESMSSRAVLTFTGGGSQYRVIVSPVYDLAGNALSAAHNFAVFTVELTDVDELLSPDTTHFETNLGAINLNVSKLSRRNIEDLMYVRAQSTGHQEQFDLIIDALRNAGIDRDTTRLKLFKG